jgi:hypothetical protein
MSAPSERLAARVPRDVIAVSESGLKSRDELARLAAAGYRAFLIGERFMTDPEPAAAIRRLTGAEVLTNDLGFIKVCGITRVSDALHAVEQGATALGFVLWPKEPTRDHRGSGCRDHRGAAVACDDRSVCSSMNRSTVFAPLRSARI